MRDDTWEVLAGRDDARPALLLVDDDATVLRGLQRILRSEASEWNLVFVHGGSAALAELGQRQYDLIVSDLNMPYVSGDMVFAEAARLQPAAMRILLTASAALACETNAHRVVPKPFSPPEFRKLLRELLATMRSWDQPSLVAG